MVLTGWYKVLAMKAENEFNDQRAYYCIFSAIFKVNKHISMVGVIESIRKVENKHRLTRTSWLCGGLQRRDWQEIRFCTW